ncbi:MAG: Uncharacterised protein [Bacteroidota bacterium]|nr:MAG: Uncharacterised protein [Bacteroidota bacterium]
MLMQSTSVADKKRTFAAQNTLWKTSATLPSSHT